MFRLINHSRAVVLCLLSSLGTLELVSLSGCGHTPITLTFYEAAGIDKRTNLDSFKLNPSLRYLRVTIKDKPLLMVLGYTEALPQGTLDTWYSNQGEVLQLLNGRVWSTAGLAIDWKNIPYEVLPTWSKLMSQGSAQFVRTHDQMPGYALGIQQKVQIYSVTAPTQSNLVVLPASQLKWFEEKVVSTKSDTLPSARYGIALKDGQPVQVYGEQCFSNELCFSWQAWPVVP